MFQRFQSGGNLVTSGAGRNDPGEAAHLVRLGQSVRKLPVRDPAGILQTDVLGQSDAAGKFELVFVHMCMGDEIMRPEIFTVRPPGLLWDVMKVGRYAVAKNVCGLQWDQEQCKNVSKGTLWLTFPFSHFRSNKTYSSLILTKSLSKKS